MKLYSDHFFPWVLDKLMSRKEFMRRRKGLLHFAEGNILEIGLGTGLNLSEYPSNTKEIYAIDVNPGMNRYVRKRAQDSGIFIHHHVITAEKLPFEDEIFDTVVSTWTFCSIPDLHQALREIHRVLKPNGKLIFIEHGLSRNPRIQWFQHKLTPLSKIFACGCHLNRDMKEYISPQQFNISSLKEFDMPTLSSFVAHAYQGVVTKK